MAERVYNEMILSIAGRDGGIRYRFSGGHLSGFLIQGSINRPIYAFLLGHIPRNEAELVTIKQQLERQYKIKTSIKAVPPDLSFERFWRDYDNKVGNMSRAKKLWRQLPEVQKILAINYIPTEHRTKAQNGQNALYPETYLSQQRWRAAL